MDISVGSDLIQGTASWIEFDLAVTTSDGTTYTLPDNGAMSILELFSELSLSL